MQSERTGTLFQINYHTYTSSSNLVPMDGEGPYVEKLYLDFQTKYASKIESLGKSIEELRLLEYPTFISALKEVYRRHTCDLKRLDSFVI